MVTLLFYLGVCSLLACSEAKETVAVNVYYESLCPDSRRFFLKQLGPSYEAMGPYMQIQFIPYGNARTHGKPDRYTFSCQHGEEECTGNIIQTCAAYVLNDTKASLDFINCAFEQADQKETIKMCIKSQDVQQKVQKCANGSLGKNMECKMGELTEALNPKQTFIPWITFNGKGSRDLNNRANDNFVEVLCEFYKKDIPEECKTQRRKTRDFYRRLVGL